jgi:hypothetical protein
MNWVFMEVFVAGTGSINVFPCCGVIEAEFIWRYTDDRAIFIVAIFDEKWDSASEKTDCAWDLMKLGEVMRNGDIRRWSEKARTYWRNPRKNWTWESASHQHSLFPMPIHQIHTLPMGESTVCI